MDLPEAEANVKRFKDRFKRIKIFPLSANEGQGLDKLLSFLSTKVGHDLNE
jgi:GTP-binding protein